MTFHDALIEFAVMLLYMNPCAGLWHWWKFATFVQTKSQF